MAEGQRSAVLGHVVELIAQGRFDEVSDGQLLERYVRARDEVAFTALVRRHGGMVLGVGRRVLRNLHDAEDAFQATFLILARKAASLDRQHSLANWLHTVAHRVALKARLSGQRRHRHETAAGTPTSEECDTVDLHELLALLDAALQRLPEKYRAPLVLCYLEGKTNEAAAIELGWPVGSMAKRLARARELLHDRLTSQGITASVGLSAAAVVEANASAPTALVENTVQAATLFAAGGALQIASPQAIQLAQGVLRTMFIKKFVLIGAVVAMLALAGTGLALATRTGPIVEQASDSSTGGRVDKPVETRKPKDDKQAKADQAAIVKGNGQFAFDLYQQLRGNKGNLFLSPYSISSALAMTEAGARGKTREQMRSTLHLDLPADRLYPSIGDLHREINGGGAKRAYELRSANALWGQKDAAFKDDYLKLLSSDLHASLNPVDFAGDTENTRKKINAAVAKQTRDRIKELLKKEDLDKATRLVLTNAIVFKADWTEQFNKQFTRERPFRGARNGAKAPFMSTINSYRQMDGGTFQALELPFTRNEVSLVVFLPKKVDGLADFEKTLTADKLAGWLAKLKEARVDLWLPKFRTTASFRLKKTLTDMGMPLAFDVSRADFTGMTASKGIFIGDVVHQAFIDVNEKGAEAAAATAVELKFGGKPPLEQPVVFHADHPFFFIIRDNQSGSILFMGRLVDPGK
jgi:serpin B